MPRNYKSHIGSVIGYRASLIRNGDHQSSDLTTRPDMTLAGLQVANGVYNVTVVMPTGNHGGCLVQGEGPQATTDLFTYTRLIMVSHPSCACATPTLKPNPVPSHINAFRLPSASEKLVRALSASV